MSCKTLNPRSDVLKRITNLPLFALPDPQYENQSIVSHGAMVAVKAHEILHRFQVDINPPTSRRGLKSRTFIGRRAALLRMLLSFSPSDYVAIPGQQVPPTPMDSTKPQRIVHNGTIQFDTPAGTGFRTFGTGTFFPAPSVNEAKFYVGAVISMLRGFGEFEGYHGMSVVNGLSEPPLNMALSIMLRIYGPHRLPASCCQVPALIPTPYADPEISFLILLAEQGPATSCTASLTASQRIQSAMQGKALRTVDIGFEMGQATGICTRMTAGPVIGMLKSNQVYFEPTEPGRIPFHFLTEGTELTFLGRSGKVAGTIQADIVEGRGFPVPAQRADADVYQVGGIAPIIKATGQLEGITGMVSMNSFFRLSDGSCSQLFVLRMIDPRGYFKMEKQ